MLSVISKCKQCRAVQVTHPGSVSSVCVEHDEERETGPLQLTHKQLIIWAKVVVKLLLLPDSYNRACFHKVP